MNTKPTNKQEDGILKVDAMGRVRTSAKLREAILDEFEKSGMPGTRFARQCGIKYTTFANWIQKRRRDCGEYPQVESSAGSKPAKRGKGATAGAEFCNPPQIHQGSDTPENCEA